MEARAVENEIVPTLVSQLNDVPEASGQFFSSSPFWLRDSTMLPPKSKSPASHSSRMSTCTRNDGLVVVLGASVGVVGLRVGVGASVAALVVAPCIVESGTAVWATVVVSSPSKSPSPEPSEPPEPL